MKRRPTPPLTPRFGGLIGSIGINVVVPLLAVQLLQRHGLSLVQALSVNAVFPAATTLFSFLRTRRVDALGALGALSLVLIVLSLAASLISGDARFALIKESLLGLAVPRAAR